MEQILNSDIRNSIKTILLNSNNPEQKLELEARFTEYNSNKGISIQTYDRIIKFFDKYKSEIIHSTDIILKSENLRFTNVNNVQILIQKNKIYSYPVDNNFGSENNNPYNLRIAISNENQIKMSQEHKIKIHNAPPKDILTRIKNRKSFFIDDYNRIDVTKVVEIQNNITISRYELELELLDLLGLDNWFIQILELLKIIQNTEIVYTFNEYSTLLKNANKYLGSYVSTQITNTPNNIISGLDNRLLMDARNLKYKDIVHKGLVDNPKTNYRVTVKSDGERKIMMISSLGIYLIWNTEVNKIYSGDNFTSMYDGYIFDGELIPEQSRKDFISQKYWYLVFDLINKNNDSNIRDKSHTHRMTEAQLFKDFLVTNEQNVTKELSDILYIETKRFYDISTVQQFYENMSHVNKHRLDCRYKEDGFIFVPDKAPYKRTTVKLSDRILTNYPDICKWKPNYTIDFAVLVVNSVNGNKIIIQGLDSKKESNLIQYKDQKYSINPIFASISISLNKSSFEYNGITYIYIKELDISNPSIKSDNIIKFTWNTNKKIYEGSISNNIKMTPFNLLKSKFEKKEDFIIGLRWKHIDNKNKIVEFYHIQKFDPNYPYLNYIDIDKPIDQQNQLLKDIPSGFIVEFYWDYDKKLFVPDRLRPNKLLPNSIETINDNLLMIDDRIELSTLLGSDIRLMRKYHNRIKKELFESTPAKYLLDLGSGRGGDIYKMKEYEKIIAVEPNEKHIIRLIELAKKIFGIPQISIIKQISDLNNISKLSNDRIIIVNTKAENYDLINSVVSAFFGKADVISMMLSLSFFWENKTILESLVKTISDNLNVGGSFIYMTIDGEKVKHTFDPLIKGPIIDQLYLNNGDIVMKYIKTDRFSNELKVQYKGTIVGDDEEQTEYLVMLDNLRQMLGEFGIKELDYESANKEQLLNDTELQLTKLYSYGKFYRVSTQSILSMDYKSSYLNKSDKVRNLPTTINPKDSSIKYDFKEQPILWYRKKLYRSSQLVLANKTHGLILAILRAINSNNLQNSNEFNIIFENLQNNIYIITQSGINLEEYQELDTPKLTDLLIKLGKFYNTDISVLEINQSNLLPIVSKIGNYDNAILIGRTENGYENIAELINGSLNFVFGSKVNLSLIIISLIGITLLDKLPNNRLKEYTEKYISIYNGDMNMKLIFEMKTLI